MKFIPDLGEKMPPQESRLALSRDRRARERESLMHRSRDSPIRSARKLTSSSSDDALSALSNAPDNDAARRAVASASVTRTRIKPNPRRTRVCARTDVSVITAITYTRDSGPLVAASPFSSPSASDRPDRLPPRVLIIIAWLGIFFASFAGAPRDSTWIRVLIVLLACPRNVARNQTH